MRRGVGRFLSILAYIGWGICWLGSISIATISCLTLAHYSEFNGNTQEHLLVPLYPIAMLPFVIMFIVLFWDNINNISRKARELWNS